MKTLITADDPTTADRSATAGSLKTVLIPESSQRKTIWLELNKAINKEWKWPFQDGTQNFGQTFSSSTKSFRFSASFSPNEVSFSALQPDSCPKSKTVNIEPEG